MKGVDDRGLEELDRQYIETIISVFTGGPAGVQSIAHTMNIPPIHWKMKSNLICCAKD